MKNDKVNLTYEIFKYPAKVLSKKTEPVTDISAETLAIIRKMFETMRESNGVGLAANQVGIPLRILVMSLPSRSDKKEREEIVLINPEIIEKSGKICDDEGCLSFPGFYFKVKRCKSVKVKAVNEKGNSFLIEGENIAARVMQHEIDHLNGKTFLSRLPLIKRLSVKREIKRKIKKGEW